MTWEGTLIPLYRYNIPSREKFIKARVPVLDVLYPMGGGSSQNGWEVVQGRIASRIFWAYGFVKFCSFTRYWCPGRWWLKVIVHWISGRTEEGYSLLFFGWQGLPAVWNWSGRLCFLLTMIHTTLKWCFVLRCCL